MEHTNPTASVDADGARASDDGSPGTAASDDVDVQFAPRAGTANGGDAPGTGAGAGVAAGVSGGGDDDNRRGSALSRRAAADAAAEYQQSEEVLAGLGVQRQRRSSMMAVRATKTFVDPVQGPTAVQRFADSTPFNTFIILCIVVNAVLIGALAAGDLACTLPDDVRRGAVCSATGIESDHMDISRQAVVRGGSVWLVIEHVFAAIFSIEMCVRWRCQLHPRGCTAAA